jgi:hypothetical protein
MNDGLAGVLRRARQRIDHPGKWISYWSISNDGKRLCASHAVLDVQGERFDEMSDLTARAIHALAEESGINPLWKDYERVAYANGQGPHRRIMAMYDRAIEKAEATT